MTEIDTAQHELNKEHQITSLRLQAFDRAYNMSQADETIEDIITRAGKIEEFLKEGC